MASIIHIVIGFNTGSDVWCGPQALKSAGYIGMPEKPFLEIMVHYLIFFFFLPLWCTIGFSICAPSQVVLVSSCGGGRGGLSKREGSAHNSNHITIIHTEIRGATESIDREMIYAAPKDTEGAYLCCLIIHHQEAEETYSFSIVFTYFY